MMNFRQQVVHARRTCQGTTQYLYGNLSQPFQITASRSPDNVLTVYYYDDFGALYALERGGARYYVGSDHLGTPKVVTYDNGTIIRQIEYDSWGVKTGDTNPSFDLPVGFAGGIPDDATGLVRFGLRDYEPASGRWTARDPISFRGGQPNLYAYTFNDPVNYNDPTGTRNYLKAGFGVLYTLEGVKITALPFVAAWAGFQAGGPAGATIAGGITAPVIYQGLKEMEHGIEMTAEGLSDPVDMNDAGGSCPAP